MGQVRIPGVVSDLYRDLRDRRLLPVVGLLLVAIVAVPLVLSTSPGSAPAGGGATVPPGSEIASETQSAVLAEAEGLRDYRKRLDELKRRNPFRPRLVAGLNAVRGVDVASAEQTDVSTGVEESSSGTPDVATESATGGTPADTGLAPVDDEPDADDDATEPDGDGDQAEPRSHRVDVRFGVAGDTRTIKGLEPGKPLGPVAAFVDVYKRKYAVFAPSAEVESATGGVCFFVVEVGCLLGLKEGQTAHLPYPPEGRTYVLRVRKIKHAPGT